MTESVELKRVAMVYGPDDDPHMYELFEGVLFDRSYFFYLENHSHLYVDGESGGLQQLAKNV